MSYEQTLSAAIAFFAMVALVLIITGTDDSDSPRL